MRNINKILPTEIISDILIRLPAESVLICKSVCKTWKSLTQHPSFPQMHLARLNSTGSGKLRYVFLYPDAADDDINGIKHLHYFEFNDDEDWNYATPLPRRIMFKFSLDAYIILGSFNGLVCIYGCQPDIPEYHGPAIIINPVTKEYVFLPEFDSYPEYGSKGLNSIKYTHVACGFGYLAETNEYKIVRMYVVGGEPNYVEVEVYTLGSGNGWRHVGRFGMGFSFYTLLEQTRGVFLDGCLHWKSCVGGTVVVFDLANEKFRPHIPPPPMLTTSDDGDMGFGDEFLVLGVSGGILYYAVGQIFEGRDYNDVWLLMKKDNHVMKKHERHHSWVWSKVITLEQREPFCFMESTTVALRYDQGNIKYFLPSTSTWENLVNFISISRQVFPHKHTFVSLKELGEVDAVIMESRVTKETNNSEFHSH